MPVRVKQRGKTWFCGGMIVAAASVAAAAVAVVGEAALDAGAAEDEDRFMLLGGDALATAACAPEGSASGFIAAAATVNIPVMIAANSVASTANTAT